MMLLDPSIPITDEDIEMERHEIEFSNIRTGVKVTSPIPSSMEDMAKLLAIFACICGFTDEAIKEYIATEGIDTLLFNACKEVRKEYEDK